MKAQETVNDVLAKLSPATQSAIASGKKVQAIRLVVEETGLGLREAKAVVETLMQQHGTGPDTPAAPGFSEEGGAGGILAIVVAVVLAYLVYRFFVAA
ncbi:MAG: hypothetical protein AAFX56_20820 [Pseudomonadota bacterium]